MTEAESQLESLLGQTLDRVADDSCPPGLANAVRYAVFPGGARIRPRLCLAVARAVGDDAPLLSAASACAIELLHCASLVHDDLPCFDAADERRGKPSVHIAHGERLAVLTGDALIVTAFESLGFAAAAAGRTDRLPALLSVLGRSSGMPMGISAGQAWECETEIDLSSYHQAKTGALFVAATESGAAAAGVDFEPWKTLGQCIGEGYQVADDIHDAAVDQESSDKPVGRDAALGRPNVVLELGLDGAVSKLKKLVAEGVESIPDCPGRDGLRKLIASESKRFLPAKFGQLAA